MIAAYLRQIERGAQVVLAMVEPHTATAADSGHDRPHGQDAADDGETGAPDTG